MTTTKLVAAIRWWDKFNTSLYIRILTAKLENDERGIIKTTGKNRK